MIATIADKMYLDIVDEILFRGVSGKNRTGVKTIKKPHLLQSFFLEGGYVPILQSKFVPFKTAVKEMLWIWQKQSNDVRELQDMGVHVWDEWMQEDGTIGKAYGYQLKKYNQVDNLIHTLKTDPQSRRMVVTMWNIDDMPDMALPPCAYETLWDVTDGYLNCMLVQRSGDMGLGVPFNTAQYAVLVHLIAHVTGLLPGRFTHIINNAHIYENHVEALGEQIMRWETIDKSKMVAPRIEINPKVTNFYDITVDDITLRNYKPLGKIPMDVVV